MTTLLKKLLLLPQRTLDLKWQNGDGDQIAGSLRCVMREGTTMGLHNEVFSLRHESQGVVMLAFQSIQTTNVHATVKT